MELAGVAYDVPAASGPSVPLALLVLLWIVTLPLGVGCGRAVSFAYRLRGPTPDRLAAAATACRITSWLLVPVWLDEALTGHGEAQFVLMLSITAAGALGFLMSVWLRRAAAVLAQDAGFASVGGAPPAGGAVLWAAKRQVAVLLERLQALHLATRRDDDAMTAAKAERLRNINRAKLVFGASMLGTAGVIVRVAQGMPASLSGVFTRTVSLYGITVLLSSTPPVLLAWLGLGLLHGRSCTRRALRQMAERVGLGTMLGLLVGSVAFAVNLVLPLDPRQPAALLSFDVLINLSVVGAAVGFWFGHLAALFETADGVTERALGWILGPISVGAAAVATQRGPLNTRRIAGKLIDAYTKGVTVPHQLNPSVIGGRDWRLYFLLDRGQLVAAMPSSGQLVALLVVSSAVTPARAAVRAWRATRAVPADATPCDRSAAGCDV